MTVQQTATASGSVTVTATATATAIGTDTGSDDQSNLSAYYKLDLPSGSNYPDSSPGNTPATATGVTTATGAIPGSSLSAHFDGSTSGIQVKFIANSVMAVAAWVRPAASPDSARHYILGAYYASAPPMQSSLFIDTDGSLVCSLGSVVAKQSTALPGGEWTHVACLIKGSLSTPTVVRLLRNGGSPIQKVDNTGGLVPGGAWVIGSNPDLVYGPSDIFNGDIDEVRIYKATVSDVQFANLYSCNMLSCPTTVSITATATATGSVSFTVTESVSATGTVSIVTSGTGTAVITRTTSSTSTATGSYSFTATATGSATATATVSTTATASASLTMTAYETTTVTATHTVTVSHSATATVTTSSTASHTETGTITVTATGTEI
jgi:hypothetical protein